MMTPEYAAPEQVLGEPITTATDVYAIGVLSVRVAVRALALCARRLRSDQLVQGRRRGNAGEVFGRALSREAGATKQRPTGEAAAATRGTTLLTLRRSLRGDIERIIQRALAKDAGYALPDGECAGR